MQESIQLVIDSLPFLLKGAGYTLQLSIGGMFLGLLLGFILALMRLSPIWPVRWLARFYISIFRGTPLIAQLFMIYYGLPQFGIELDPIPSAMIGLSLNTAAYAGPAAQDGLGHQAHRLVLTHHTLVEDVLQVEQLLPLPLHQAGDGDAGPCSRKCCNCRCLHPSAP